jgi:hypothetical protein
LENRKLQNCGNPFIFQILNIEIRARIVTSVNDEVFCHFEERENMFKPKLLRVIFVLTANKVNGGRSKIT